MTTERIAEILSTLTTDEGTLVGAVEPALRLLGSLDVRLAFERLIAESDAGVLFPDEVHQQIVFEAWAVRVAVARRWQVAGASVRERRLATEVDQALAPLRSAILIVDDFEHFEDWMEDLWIDGLDVDTKAWWGWPLSESWYLAGEAVASWIAQETRRRLPKDRHEDYWDDWDRWGSGQCGAFWCSWRVWKRDSDYCEAHEVFGQWADVEEEWEEAWEKWAAA